MDRFFLRDLRGGGACLGRTRAFFARHGLDWDVFRREGLPLDALRATGDEAARKVIAAAEARIAAERGAED